MLKDTLFFDGNCPICSAEMRKLSRFSGGKIRLQNIHDLPESPSLPPKHVLISELHLLTPEGKWLKGIDANIRAWRHTPFRYFWQFLGLPGIRRLTELGYRSWLGWRERKSCGEQSGSCER